MKATKYILIIILLALLLGSCARVDETPIVQPGDNYGVTKIIKVEETHIVRFIDEEAGVVCYLYAGYERGGLSCLPLDQTLLRQR